LLLNESCYNRQFTVITACKARVVCRVLLQEEEFETKTRFVITTIWIQWSCYNRSV